MQSVWPSPVGGWGGSRYSSGFLTNLPEKKESPMLFQWAAYIKKSGQQECSGLLIRISDWLKFMFAAGHSSII